MKVIGIGDNVVDYYQDQEMMYPGGNAVNVTVASKRMGAEECAYLGIVGDDAAAKHIIRCLRSENIDISRIRQVHGPSGEAVVTLTEEGDRVFVSTNKDIRVQSLFPLRLTNEDMTYINQYDLIHMSVNSDADHELPCLAHKPISFDFSTPARWTEEYLESICPYIAYAFFSGSELSIQEIRALIKRVHSLGVKVVGVTRGGEAAIFSEKGEIFEQKPVRTNIIDTMGAGDSFIGGFLTSYHGTEDIKKALYQAAQLAALTCQSHGGFGYGMKRNSELLFCNKI